MHDGEHDRQCSILATFFVDFLKHGSDPEIKAARMNKHYILIIRAVAIAPEKTPTEKVKFSEL